MPVSNRSELGRESSFQMIKSWINTPKYREKVVKGLILPNNPFVSQRLSTRSPIKPYRRNESLPVDEKSFQDYYGTTWTDARRRLDENNGYFRVPTAPNADAEKWQEQKHGRVLMETLAGNRLSKKIQNRDIDLGVALGEARETAHFIQTAMISTFVAAKRARRGNLSGTLEALGLSTSKHFTETHKQRLRDVPDKVSAAWLGYSYGVRPLMADVLGACKALEKRNEIPHLVTHRVAERQAVDVSLRTYYGTSLPWWTDPDSTLVYKGECICRDQVTWTVDNPVLYQLSGLGLTNPLSVAYELITLSFVLDWFIPVGSWIAGLVPPQGVSDVKRVQTWAGDVTCEGSLDWRVGKLPVSARSIWKERKVSSTIPKFHLVGANFDLSKQQIASGLSLLWTFGGRRKSEAKAYKDAIDLNSRGYSTSAGNMSRARWGGSPFPTSHAQL